jgi:hypothetical protein
MNERNDAYDVCATGVLAKLTCKPADRVLLTQLLQPRQLLRGSLRITMISQWCLKLGVSRIYSPEGVRVY